MKISNFGSLQTKVVNHQLTLGRGVPILYDEKPKINF